MRRMALSKAAAALLRGLVARAGSDRDRILLTECRSADWQSLTFVGERHYMLFRIDGAGGRPVFECMTAGLADAELAVPGGILADIAVEGTPTEAPDGSIAFGIEALTIEQ